MERFDVDVHVANLLYFQSGCFQADQVALGFRLVFFTVPISKNLSYFYLPI